MRTDLSFIGAAALLLWLPAAMGQGVQEAGTAVREERSVQMSENVYRRITAVHELLGMDDLQGAIERLDDLLELRERYGFSYIVIWPPMEPFAPVIKRLAGR